MTRPGVRPIAFALTLLAGASACASDEKPSGSGTGSSSAVRQSRVPLGPAPARTAMDCGITLRQFEAIVGGTWRQRNFGTKIQCLFEQGKLSVSMGRHRYTADFAAYVTRNMRTINPKATCTPRAGYERVVCSSDTEVSGSSYRDGVLVNALGLGDALHGPLSAADQRRLEVIVGKIIDN